MASALTLFNWMGQVDNIFGWKGVRLAEVEPRQSKLRDLIKEGTPNATPEELEARALARYRTLLTAKKKQMEASSEILRRGKPLNFR